MSSLFRNRRRRPNRTRRAPEGIQELDIKKVVEYLKHAAECRQTARGVAAEHREELEEMARAWEQLAEARWSAIADECELK
jgi:sugar phosphate isomerase/epimerase